MNADLVPPPRRPELYHPLTQLPPALAAPGERVPQLVVAEVAPHAHGDPDRSTRACADAVAGGADLVVLGELAGCSGDDLAALAAGDDVPARAAGASLIAGCAEALAGTDAHVVCTVVQSTRDGAAHVGVVVGAGGPALHQSGLHLSRRHPWQAAPGDRQKVLSLPAGGVSVLVGDDLLVPEAARLACLGGADLLVAPLPAGVDAATVAALVQATARWSGAVVVAVWPGGARHADPVRPGSGPARPPIRWRAWG